VDETAILLGRLISAKICDITGWADAILNIRYYWTGPQYPIYDITGSAHLPLYAIYNITGWAHHTQYAILLGQPTCLDMQYTILLGGPAIPNM
jgi:hypothetical protein